MIAGIWEASLRSYAWSTLEVIDGPSQHGYGPIVEMSKGFGYRSDQMSNTFFLAAAYSSSVNTPDLCSSANFFSCSVGSDDVAGTGADCAGCALTFVVGWRRHRCDSWLGRGLRFGFPPKVAPKNNNIEPMAISVPIGNDDEPVIFKIRYAKVYGCYPEDYSQYDPQRFHSINPNGAIRTLHINNK